MFSCQNDKQCLEPRAELSSNAAQLASGPVQWKQLQNQSFGLVLEAGIDVVSVCHAER